MLSAPLLICFLLWIGVGVWLWRSAIVRRFAARLSRSSRSILAPLLLLGSAGLLLAALLGLQNLGAISEGRLAMWAIGALAAIGSLFVCAQVAAMELLFATLQENVTWEQRPPSDPKEGKSE